MPAGTPIRPVAVDVLGVHPKDQEALVVEVHLSSTPSRRWSDLFARLGEELIDPRASQTSLDGPVVVLTSRDRDMEKQLQALERLIRHTNARLRDEVQQPAPNERASMRMSQAIAQDSMSPEIRRRLEAAKRKAKSMTGVFESSHWEALELTPLETALVAESPEVVSEQIVEASAIDPELTAVPSNSVTTQMPAVTPSGRRSRSREDRDTVLSAPPMLDGDEPTF